MPANGRELDNGRSSALEDSEAARSHCRICLEGEDDDEEDGDATRGALMELRCACTDAHVHRSCASRWFGARGTTMCEICKHDTGLTGLETPLALRVSRGTMRVLGWRRDEADDETEAAVGPSFGTVIYIFLFELAVVWFSLEIIMGYTTGTALAMAYGFALSLLVGCCTFIYPLRQARVNRDDSRHFLWAYALCMFISHQVTFFISLQAIQSRKNRAKEAISLTLALSIAALAYPQFVVCVGCLWRFFASDDR
ncbi:hypothetical protein BE221DRAFT_211474 [Ostreococcus tauri]|uniref:Uncharacterized protein n=1 Tax=Ostreococcus tauri TaxID=70448 RepID=A0A1Y5IMF9_OSTTA|nr:hypothetical protein BE221DRAFT_211474 [Ostreococcus tauri]